MRITFGVKYRNFGCSGDSYAVFITHVAVLLYLVRVVNAIKISSISVPRSVDNSTSEPVKLDCLFQFEQSEQTLQDRELVVQWLLNNSTLLYQWVHNGTAFINKKFKDCIEVGDITTSTVPKNIPLTLLCKSIELTGQYTCHVQTFTSDDSVNAELQIYVPVNEISLDVVPDENTNKLNVTCSARGIYPRPEIVLSVNKSPEITNSSTELRGYLYDVTTTYSTPLKELSAVTNFNCTISWPNANISRSRARFYTKSGSQTSDSSVSFEYINNTSPLTHQKKSGAKGQRHRNVFLLFFTLLVIFSMSKQ